MKYLLKYDAQKAFIQSRILMGVVFISIAGIIGTQGLEEYIRLGGNVDSEVMVSVVALEGMRSDIFLFFVPIFAPLPFAISFIEEIESRFYLFSTLRTGKKRYFISKAFFTWITGGLCALLGGVLLTIAIMFLHSTHGNMGVSKSMGMLVVQLVVIFLSGGLWSLIGGVFSITMRSKYMAYVAPFVMYYVLSVFQERYYPQFYFLSPKEWGKGTQVLGGSVIPLFLILCSIMFAIYISLMNRRVQNA